jgi:4-hydroxy-3-polyprenylbenzoate decarboxylase
MTQVTELGGLIMPPMPAFYHRPQSLAEIIDQTVNRVLDQFGIALTEDLFKRWSGPTV